MSVENAGPIKRAPDHMSCQKYGLPRKANMFTDQPVTPARLECLIDLLREYNRREWTRIDITGVLQPKGLPDLGAASQAGDAITAAIELGLLAQNGSSIILA